MKAIKPNFKTSNIRVIMGLLIVLLLLLSFGLLRDTDTFITHDQANILYTEDKIQKITVDGEILRIKTNTENFKIYKDAINKTAFFTKYPVEVREDKSYLYDIFFLLIVIAAFGFFYRFMQQNKLQQLRHIRATSKSEDPPVNDPVQARSAHVPFQAVAGINDGIAELDEIIDFLDDPK